MGNFLGSESIIPSSIINEYVENNNPNLESYYMYSRNSDGNISFRYFWDEIIRTDDRNLAEKIFAFFSDNNKMSFSDLKFFYTLFKINGINSNEYKLGFISQLLFNSNNEIKLMLYKQNVILYFPLIHKNDKTKTFAEYFSNKLFQKIKKERNEKKEIDIIYKEEFENMGKKIIKEFDYFSVIESLPSSQYKDFNKKYNSYCDCVKLKHNTNLVKDIIKDIYLVNLKNKCKSEYSYEEIEKIFQEVEIDDIFIKVLINYLKKKTLKNKIDIYTLIHLLYKICLAKKEDEKGELSFELLSFPNKEIKNLNEILLDNSIQKNSLSKEEYLNLFKNSKQTNSLTEFIRKIPFYFENINLIPFIVFEQKPYESQIIKKVIKFFLKDNKNFDEFCKEQLKTESRFYAINYDFKLQLIEYLENNNINEKKPKMNLNLISNPNIKGRLKPNLIYEQDFFVLPNSLYQLFKRWFLSIGNDIILEKIEYKEDEIECDNEHIYHPGGKSLINIVEDKYLEVEFYPIHTLIFTASEIYYFLKKTQKYKFVTLQDIIDLLKEYYENITDSKRSRYYSRKKIINTVLNDVQGPIKNLKEPQVVYFNGEKFDANYTNKSFEFKKIKNVCILIINSKFNKDVTFLEQMKERENEEYIKNHKEEEEEEEIKKEEEKKKEKEEKKKEINKKEEKDKNEEKTFKSSPIGLSNIGNTCYLNSVLQCLINLPILKDLILNEKIIFFINRKNKNSNKGEFIDIFSEIIKHRWLKAKDETNNIINPKNVKNILGKIRKDFNSFEQQDANEFLNFVLDELHEELNLKNEKIYIPNPEDNISQINSSEELSNIYWSNSIRRGTSFINSIFSFQLKSILTCQQCKKEKISFETNTNLYLPIPLSKFIDVEVVLIRLPFCYKLYYDEVNEDFQLFNNENKDKSKIENLKTFALNKLTNDLFKEKQNNEDYEFISNNDFKKAKFRSVFVGNVFKNNNNKEQEKELEKIRRKEEEKQKKIEMQYYNIYNFIPAKVKITLNKNDKVITLINKLRKIKSLELEYDKNESNDINLKNNNIQKVNIKNYTSFIICNVQRSYKLTINPISQDLIVDDCLQENSRIYVYEVLNSNGINELKKNLFNYQKMNDNNNKQIKINPEYNLVNYTINQEPKNFNQIYNEDKNNIKEKNEILSLDNKMLYYQNEKYSSIKNINLKMEYLLEIRHYYSSLYQPYLFDKFKIFKLDFYTDFILLNNTENNLTSQNLYDYIWEKYRKFLSISNKSDDEIWWRSKNENTKICYPFLIRITIQLKNKEKTKCAFCPWYKFCPGCILEPNDCPLELELNNIIHVEWCKNLKDNELMEKNLKNLYDIKIEEEDNLNDKLEKNSQIENNLRDCFNLFLREEKLEDKLSCPYCKLKQEFTKNYLFDKLPQVLIISLKRFKYATMYRNKINTFIKYPLENLEINHEKFDLYAVINHFGNLNSGHYTSYVKIDNQWFDFDDSIFNSCHKDKIINKNAYILFYINQCKPEDKMYFKLLQSILKQLNYNEDKKFLNKNIKENKIIYPDLLFGEPINYNDQKGYFVGTSNTNLIKVQFPKSLELIDNQKISQDVKLILGKSDIRNEENIYKIETDNSSTVAEIQKTFSGETIFNDQFDYDEEDIINTKKVPNVLNLNQDYLFNKKNNEKKVINKNDTIKDNNFFSNNKSYSTILNFNDKKNNNINNKNKENKNNNINNKNKDNKNNQEQDCSIF